ncbi:MAG: hypothetical protein SNJ73_02905, partial [Acetobacteraceae bacterium]
MIVGPKLARPQSSNSSPGVSPPEATQRSARPGGGDAAPQVGMRDRGVGAPRRQDADAVAASEAARGEHVGEIG